MPIAEVSEIVDIFDGQECASCERMDRSITPLAIVSTQKLSGHEALTRSIQKPPLWSII